MLIDWTRGARRRASRYAVLARVSWPAIAGPITGLVDDAPVEDAQNPVGQREQFVEILAHEEHGGAAIARGEDAVVDLRHRGEVEPEDGVGGDEDRGIA